MSKIIVKENGRERTIFLPNTGDRSYDEALREAYVEKTRDELRKMPPKEKGNMSRQDIKEYLRERREFNEYKKRGSKKYF